MQRLVFSDFIQISNIIYMHIAFKRLKMETSSTLLYTMGIVVSKEKQIELYDGLLYAKSWINSISFSACKHG